MVWMQLYKGVHLPWNPRYGWLQGLARRRAECGNNTFVTGRSIEKRYPTQRPDPTLAKACKQRMYTM